MRMKNERTVLRNHLITRKRNGRERKGRGFSREELRSAGIDLKQALRKGLPIDARRRTAHEENVRLAKQQLPPPKITKKRAPKAKKKI